MNYLISEFLFRSLFRSLFGHLTESVMDVPFESSIILVLQFGQMFSLQFFIELSCCFRNTIKITAITEKQGHFLLWTDLNNHYHFRYAPEMVLAETDYTCKHNLKMNLGNGFVENFSIFFLFPGFRPNILFSKMSVKICHIMCLN